MTNAQPALTLPAAESFISGFEDDELQEGVPELLESMRSVIEAAR